MLHVVALDDVAASLDHVLEESGDAFALFPRAGDPALVARAVTTQVALDQDFAVPAPHRVIRRPQTDSRERRHQIPEGVRRAHDYWVPARATHIFDAERLQRVRLQRLVVLVALLADVAREPLRP